MLLFLERLWAGGEKGCFAESTKQTKVYGRFWAQANLSQNGRF
jgi:hypothetical protein